MQRTPDVIVVGARPAGAATALLLARAGHSVTVVDRGRRGSDTLSTHALLRPALLLLERWGLLDAVVRAGAPAVEEVVFHYGDEVVTVGTKRPLRAPRRTTLDPTLVDAAEAAGATFRFGVDVRELLRGPDGAVVGVAGRARDGTRFEARARVTVGADGRRSLVARAVDAPLVHRGTTASAAVYGYWSGVAARGYEWCFRPGATAGLIPTEDDLTCVFVGVPADRLRAEARGDLPGMVERVLRQTSPDVADRVGAGRREGRVRGFAGLPSVLRQPWGDGWALVGDAGSWKDPAAAHGLSAALRDASLLATALDEELRWRARTGAALAREAAARHARSLPLIEVADGLAGFAWDLPAARSLHLRLSQCVQREVDAIEAADAVAAAAA